MPLVFCVHSEGSYDSFGPPLWQCIGERCRKGQHWDSGVDFSGRVAWINCAGFLGCKLISCKLVCLLFFVVTAHWFFAHQFVTSKSHHWEKSFCEGSPVEGCKDTEFVVVHQQLCSCALCNHRTSSSHLKREREIASIMSLPRSVDSWVNMTSEANAFVSHAIQRGFQAFVSSTISQMNTAKI